jgi:hypothetical protein
MRQYHAEHEEWLRGTGGKPHKVCLNSIDARSWLAADRRYSRSATEREPEQVQPQTTTAPQFRYIGCGGQRALPCGQLLDLMNPDEILVVFGVDYYFMLSVDQRYQPLRAP